MSSIWYSEQYTVQLAVQDTVSSTGYSEQYKLVSDYEALLSSLVGGEVNKLPRGLYHTAMRRHGLSSNQDKAIGSIPAFISQQYDKTKQPGLRPSLAGNVSPRVWQITSVPASGR